MKATLMPGGSVQIVLNDSDICTVTTKTLEGALMVEDVRGNKTDCPLHVSLSHTVKNLYVDFDAFGRNGFDLPHHYFASLSKECLEVLQAKGLATDRNGYYAVGVYTQLFLERVCGRADNLK